MKDKIVFLLNSPYPYYTGGRETWINNVTNRLIDDYEIVIIAEDHVRKAYSADRWKIDPRIVVKNVKSLLSYKCLLWLCRSYISYLNCFLSAYMMRKELIKHLNPKQRTYVIAMDTVFPPMAFRGIKEKYPNVRTVISSRGPHAEISSSYWPLAKKNIFKLEKKNLTLVDAVWSNGYDTQALLKKKGFESLIICNGVDCEGVIHGSIRPHDEISKGAGTKIATIGTLLDLKGYPTMIAAISKLKDAHPEHIVDLYAFGKGDSSGYMAMAANLGIADRIHFLGEDKNAALYAKQADVLLALGTSEGSGMSMAALEMLATGVPVIATDIPCYQQIITNGENGVLVPEGDESALADAIDLLANMDGEDKKKIGRSAQERVYRNDWTSVVNTVRNELRKTYGN